MQELSYNLTILVAQSGMNTTDLDNQTDQSRGCVRKNPE